MLRFFAKKVCFGGCKSQKNFIEEETWTGVAEAGKRSVGHGDDFDWLGGPFCELGDYISHD